MWYYRVFHLGPKCLKIKLQEEDCIWHSVVILFYQVPSPEYNYVFCLESIHPDDMVVQRLERSKTKYCLEYSQISRISDQLHHLFEYIEYIIEVRCMILLSWKCSWRNRRRIRFSFCYMRKLYIGVALTIISTNENILCV